MSDLDIAISYLSVGLMGVVIGVVIGLRVGYLHGSQRVREEFRPKCRCVDGIDPCCRVHGHVQ